MLIVPYTHDQPDNAFRTTRMGCVLTRARSRYDAASAALCLRELLEQPKYTAAARWVAAQLATEDGVGAACNAVEECLAGTNGH